MRFFCVRGVWEAKVQWEFHADRNNSASIVEIGDDLKYEDLIQMVKEDFQIVNQEISLSYGMSLANSCFEESPPVCIRNDRNLRTLINLIKAHQVDFCRLCVKVNEQVDNIERTLHLQILCGDSQDVRHNTHQKQQVNEQVDNIERTLHLQNLCGDSQDVRHNSHQKQQERVGNDFSASGENNTTSSSASKTPISRINDEYLGRKQQKRTGNDFSASGVNNNTCSTSDKSEPSVILQPIPDFSPVHYGLSPSSTRHGVNDIHENKHFKNKEELMFSMRKWALEWKFEFTSRWSNPGRVVLCCVDKKCTWNMVARKLPSSDFFVVKKYVHAHTCDTTHRNANHRQATAKFLGSLICSNFGEKKEGLTPYQIIEQVRLQHGVQISYKQAWRVKEEAQKLIRGTAEDSYYNLSKWLFKVKEKNPGSVAYLEMDAAGKFKYTFVAFGPSIRGFSLMRRVIAIDGTFLKGKFKGTLLGASAQDGDYHLYPLAFGIVDSENEDSWSWFLRGMTTMIPDAEDLVFVSDRAPCIAAALAKVYPLAHHGICRIHLLRNLKPKYAKSGLVSLVESAADAYTSFEFNEIFNEIKDQSPALGKYLEEADVRRWTRSYAPANRYNIMTTNIAESLNSILRMPRELPIISLLETIRLTLTTWFHERREMAAKHGHLVTPRVVKKMVSRYDAAMTLNVYPVSNSEFEVKDEIMRYVVDLDKKLCTCKVFDIDKIPCIHAIAAAKRSKRDENRLVDPFHFTETWGKAYAESIHPCGDLTNCTFPEAVADFSCPPPATKRSSGRPPTKRIRSVGEFGIPGSKSQSHKCSRCGVGGHNKTTCKTAI